VADFCTSIDEVRDLIYMEFARELHKLGVLTDEERMYYEARQEQKDKEQQRAA
jgi:hypothetical protein